VHDNITPVGYRGRGEGALCGGNAVDIQHGAALPRIQHTGDVSPSVDEHGGGEVDGEPTVQRRRPVQHVVAAQEKAVARGETIEGLRAGCYRRACYRRACCRGILLQEVRAATCHTRQPMTPATMLVPKKTRVVCSHSSTVTADPNSNLGKQ
jgi:hypothetical protein